MGRGGMVDGVVVLLPENPGVWGESGFGVTGCVGWMAERDDATTGGTSTSSEDDGWSASLGY